MASSRGEFIPRRLGLTEFIPRTGEFTWRIHVVIDFTWRLNVACSHAYLQYLFPCCVRLDVPGIQGYQKEIQSSDVYFQKTKECKHSKMEGKVLDEEEIGAAGELTRMVPLMPHIRPKGCGPPATSAHLFHRTRIY